MSLRLWLLGSGIAGSPSPAMQEAALREMGIEGWYRIVDVDRAGLDAVLARLRAGEADGANVTIPHKRAAAGACDRLVGDAALLGAVNTLVVSGGRLTGHNTDALGLMAALRHHGLWPAAPVDDPMVLLGAGGAAAAAGLVLRRAGGRRIVVAARRLEAAEATAGLLRAVGDGVARSGPARVEAVALDGIRALLPSAAWLVNATPAGAADLGIDVAVLPAAAVVVDLRYRPRPVDLVAAARAAGLHTCDGLEMLLRQGMESLRLWSGGPPPVAAARATLLAAVGEAESV